MTLRDALLTLAGPAWELHAAAAVATGGRCWMVPMSSYAAADDLQALRAEIEQIKTRQTAARAATPTQPRTSSKPAAKPEPPPLPFRIVGAELRAGQLSVSVVPSSGNSTPDQLQVLLPGDAVGPWRLQAIDGSAAVFQAGDQTRRVAIP